MPAKANSKDDTSKELLPCPECKRQVHTRPTEGVPEQALRTCDRCGADFFMDMKAPAVYPKPGRSKAAKARKEVVITFRADTMSGEAHPSINVKCYNCPDVDASEDARSQAWDNAVEIFWADAFALAQEHGYSGVFSEGRSEGWLVPFYQYKDNVLQKWSRWPGQGELWSYPTYPDVYEKRERTRFVNFRAEVLRLIEEAKQRFVELAKEYDAENTTA